MNYKSPFFILFLLITACSTTQKKESVEPIEEIPTQRDIRVLPPVETQVYFTKPVVKRLLLKAKKRFQEKNYHATVDILEMAIDISPNNPFTWQQLALVRLKQQDYSQAEQLAVKSNLLSEQNNELRLKNWQIIAEAKRGLQSP